LIPLLRAEERRLRQWRSRRRDLLEGRIAELGASHPRTRRYQKELDELEAYVTGLGKLWRMEPYRSINRGTKPTGGPLNEATHLWSAGDYPAGHGSRSRSLLPRRGICPRQPFYPWTHS
jgi:hypothetical protein